METTTTNDLGAHIALIKQNGIAALQRIHGLDKLEVLRWSDRVVEGYGKVFRERKALIMDVSLLPCSKEELLVALKVQFYAFALKRNTDAMEDIARAYLNVSRFQVIVLEDQRMLDELNLHAVPVMDPFSAMKDRTDLSEQEQRFLECFKTFHRYLGVVEAEKDVLREDFAGFAQGLHAG